MKSHTNSPTSPNVLEHSGGASAPPPPTHTRLSLQGEGLVEDEATHGLHANVCFLHKCMLRG